MRGKERVRVAYFSDARYTGGAERYLHLLASNLDNDLFDPLFVLCSSQGLGKLREWLKESDLPAYEVDWRSLLHISGSKAFVRLLRSLGPDILHMNLPGPFDSKYSMAAPLAKMAGVRNIVSTEHLPMIHSFTKARILRSFAGRSIDRVITVSSDNAAHLEKNHHVDRSRIRVVYNGIPDPGNVIPCRLFEESGAVGERQGRFQILLVGAIEERKGHQTMLDAMSLLPDSHFLAIVGEGPGKSLLESSIKKMGLDTRVRLFGFRDDIPSIMAGSDLLVVPSTLEATPYVIIEAFAAGLPVVASRIYGIPELVEEGVTGFLARPGDHEDFAQAITKISNDREMRRSIGSAARKMFLERFEIGLSVKQTSEIYRGLSKHGPGRSDS